MKRSIDAQTGETAVEAGRKTYKEEVRPTPAYERELEQVLWSCLDRHNVA